MLTANKNKIVLKYKSRWFESNYRKLLDRYGVAVTLIIALSLSGWRNWLTRLPAKQNIIGSTPIPDSNMKTALYTGSFDPFTKGHLDLIQRSAKIFAKVVIAVGVNPNKKYLFSLEKRLQMIKANIKESNVEITTIPDGRFTADIAYEQNAVIIKGVRINADFDYEKLMHDINAIHSVGVDTMIFPSQPSMSHISSSAAKEICKLHGNTENFVPLNVKFALEETLVKQKRIIVTGSIASGKSTIVSEMVRLQPGKVHNIDMDAIAHDILFSRQEEIYKILRNDIRDTLKLKEFNRKELGDAVFNDNESRAYLDEKMRQPLLTRVRAELKDKEGVIVFNGALMIDKDWLDIANNNIFLLYVDKEEQIKRLKNRGYSDEKIAQRLSSQLNFQDKCRKATEIINRDKYGQVIILDTERGAEYNALLAFAHLGHLHS